MRMDDVAGPSYNRQPNWQKIVQRTDDFTSSDPIQYTETGQDPMESHHKSTQTEIESASVSLNLSISEGFLKIIEDNMKEAQKIRRLFDKLLPFHIKEAAKIQLARTIAVTAIPSDALPVQKMVVGSSGRVALLSASMEHETWCSHNAYVIVCHWGKQYALPQAVCPTCAVWGKQGQLIIATHTGTVELYHGQQLLSSCQIHEGPVTVIDWTGRELISSGTDGCVVLSLLKGTSFEKAKSINLVVADLPRQIRRGGLASRALGIVSLSRKGRSLTVASETGGIWKLSIPDLIVIPVIATPTSIEMIIALEEDKLVIKDVNQHISIITPEGSVEDDQLFEESRWLFSSGTLLISSDEHKLTIFDTITSKKLCKTSLRLKAAASSTQDEFFILNEHNELQVYTISY